MKHILRLILLALFWSNAQFAAAETKLTNANPSITSFDPSSAAKGTRVYITGTNLSNVKSVTFGGVAAASFAMLTPTSIYAVVGEGTSGDIVVTTTDGTAALAGFTFIPGPTISSFSPTSAYPGDTVTITGTNFDAVTGVYFDVYAAAFFKVISPTSIKAVVSRNPAISIAVATAGGYITKSGFTYLGPVLSTTSDTFSLLAQYGNASPPAKVTFSGANLLGEIVINSSTGFELSKDNITYSNTITFPNSRAYAPTVYYARIIKGIAVGYYTADLTYTTPGISGYNIGLGGTVVFALPPDNFKITNNNVTCKGSNNGIINITAQQNFNYTATITNSAGVSTTRTFTNTTDIYNLAPGAYNICFSVAGQSSFKQCFTSVITEPKDLSVYTTLIPATNQAMLTLDGGDIYHITLNGVTSTTTDTQLRVDLKPGANQLSITTDKDCQGIYTKTITIAEGITLYPNPFTQMVSINLGNDLIKSTKVFVYDAFTKVVFSKQFSNQSGSVQLDLSKLTPGVYMVEVIADGKQGTHKIIKN